MRSGSRSTQARPGPRPADAAVAMPSKRTRRVLGAAMLAALVVGAAVVAQTAAGRSLLHDAGLTSPGEHYTELAFARPAQLPKELPRGESQLRAPFTLHNVEGTSREYRWTLTAAREGGAAARLDSGAERLGPGERAYVRARGRIDCGGGRTRIELRLDEPRQALGFWTRCAPEVSGGG